MKKVLFLLMMVMMLAACQGQVSDNNNQVTWKEYNDGTFSFSYPETAVITHQDDQGSGTIKIDFPKGYLYLDRITETSKEHSSTVAFYGSINCAEDPENTLGAWQGTAIPKGKDLEILQEFMQRPGVLICYDASKPTLLDVGSLSSTLSYEISQGTAGEIKDFLNDVDRIKTSLKVK